VKCAMQNNNGKTYVNEMHIFSKHRQFFFFRKPEGKGPLGRLNCTWEDNIKIDFRETRTALGPTQPPIQWIQWALSLGIKRPGSEADHSPTSSVEVKE
jgi:hypothetical protein